MAKKKGPPLATFLKRFSRETGIAALAETGMFAPNVAAAMDTGCPTGDISAPNAAIKPR